MEKEFHGKLNYQLDEISPDVEMTGERLSFVAQKLLTGDEFLQSYAQDDRKK